MPRSMSPPRRRKAWSCAELTATPKPPMELTWGLILAVMRHLVPEANALREQGPWQQSVGRDLHGARLGLPGLGGIRQRVLRIGPAVGMQVSAWRPSLDAGHAEAAGVHLVASGRRYSPAEHTGDAASGRSHRAQRSGCLQPGGRTHRRLTAGRAAARAGLTPIRPLRPRGRAVPDGETPQPPGSGRLPVLPATARRHWLPRPAPRSAGWHRPSAPRSG